MADKKEFFGLSSYIIGIVSIVLGITSPIAGIILGIVGLNISKRQKDEFSVKGRKFSTIGIIIGLVLFIVSIVLAIIFGDGGAGLQNFPVS